MAGTFKFGDTLIFDDSMLSQTKRGDVLGYNELDRAGDGGEIVHRVLKVLPEGMLVQGDTNPCPDSRKGPITCRRTAGNHSSGRT